MPPKKKADENIFEYLFHFFRFLGSFLVILGTALFLFRFSSTELPMTSTATSESSSQTTAVSDTSVSD